MQRLHAFANLIEQQRTIRRYTAVFPFGHICLPRRSDFERVAIAVAARAPVKDRRTQSFIAPLR